MPNRPQIARIAARRPARWDELDASTGGLRRLQTQGLIERENGSVRLTPAGLAAAAEVTRTHRLWELFLVESAGIASDHVDRDADDVEHMLPTGLIRELEERLAAAGRLPVVPANCPRVAARDAVTEPLGGRSSTTGVDRPRLTMNMFTSSLNSTGPNCSPRRSRGGSFSSAR